MKYVEIGALNLIFFLLVFLSYVVHFDMVSLSEESCDLLISLTLC